MREYFEAYIGYWERRAAQLEERLVAENFEERARILAAAREREIREAENGPYVSACRDKTPVPTVDFFAESIDPESVRQRARIKAYHLLLEEMEVKKRMEGLPSLEKWAKKIGVHPSTVSRWRQDHEEFDAACADCLCIQTDILRDGGLSGVYNGRLVTFLMERNEQRAQDADERSVGYTQMEDFEDD